MGSIDLRSSRALIFSNISAGTGSVLRRYLPEGICCDVAYRLMVHTIFFLNIFGSWLEAVCYSTSMSTISARYLSQLAFLKLNLV